MKPDAEIRAMVDRVRRSTRNGDILDLCDELLTRLAQPQSAQSGPKRDRAGYMQAYRRKVKEQQNARVDL